MNPQAGSTPSVQTFPSRVPVRLVDSRHQPSTSIYLRVLVIFEPKPFALANSESISTSGTPRLLTAAPMRGRLQAARTPIDANANVCRKSVHEWDGQLQSTDFWVFMSVRPLSPFLPLLIIDIVNLISDFDTAPPGTPESNTILTMSPSTF